MNKFLFLTLAVLSLAISCSPKKTNQSVSTYQNKIILSAFSDSTTWTTLDLEELKDLPRIVDLGADLTVAKNQNDRGTCTFFSTISLVEATIKKDLKKDVNLSEEYLNYATKTAGSFADDEGSNIFVNLSAIKKSGLMLERDSSYQPSWFTRGLPCEKYKSTDTTAPANCFSHSEPSAEMNTKIISADNITFNSIPKNTNEIIKFLANNRRPLTASVSVNFKGWPDSGDVYYNNSLRAECLSGTSACGGHSILLTGYDMDKKVFFFKNSWGKEWGKNGLGTITFDTIDRYGNQRLYSAEVTGDLNLPADYAKDKYNMERFSSSINLKDNALQTTIDLKMNGVKNHLVYVSSFIVMAPNYISEPASDFNTSPLPLNVDEKLKLNGETTVRSLLYMLDPNTDTLESPANGTILSIPQSTLAFDSVAQLFNSTTMKPFMRTTLYIYTDEDAFKILKRVYQPMPVAQ